jgi:hypothetical protein
VASSRPHRQVLLEDCRGHDKFPRIDRPMAHGLIMRTWPGYPSWVYPTPVAKGLMPYLPLYVLVMPTSQCSVFLASSVAIS